MKWSTILSELQFKQKKKSNDLLGLVLRLGDWCPPECILTNTHRNKSGDDCDELDADWMTVCQLILEIYNTHKPYSKVEWFWLAYWSHMTQSAVSCTCVCLLIIILYYAGALRLGSFAEWTKAAGKSVRDLTNQQQALRNRPDLVRWVFVVYVPSGHPSSLETRLWSSILSENKYLNPYQFCQNV